MSGTRQMLDQAVATYSVGMAVLAVIMLAVVMLAVVMLAVIVLAVVMVGSVTMAIFCCPPTGTNEAAVLDGWRRKRTVGVAGCMSA